MLTGNWKELGADGKLVYKYELEELYGPYCWYCGCKLNEKVGSPRKFTIDHIIPRKLGGTDTIENMVPCCSKCNYEKGTMSYSSFVNKIGGLSYDDKNKTRRATS